MKYASAMRFGGELVEASECDYEDYKYLGLLCPECKDPVFLRGEGTRVLKGGEVKVGACFCHFPGKDPSLIAQCENRVKKYTTQEITTIKAKAKGQRLKLLQRWFWQIISSHPKFNNISAADENIKRWYSGKYYLFQETIDMSTDAFRAKVENKDVVRSLLHFISEPKEKCNPYLFTIFFAGLENPQDVIRQMNLISQADIRIHKEICIEVIDFLNGKSQYHLTQSLVELELKRLFGGTDWESDKNTPLPELVNQLIAGGLIGGIGTVLTTPWAEEFAKLQKQAVSP